MPEDTVESGSGKTCNNTQTEEHKDSEDITCRVACTSFQHKDSLCSDTALTSEQQLRALSLSHTAQSNKDKTQITRSNLSLRSEDNLKEDLMETSTFNSQTNKDGCGTSKLCLNIGNELVIETANNLDCEMLEDAPCNQQMKPKISISRDPNPLETKGNTIISEECAKRLMPASDPVSSANGNGNRKKVSLDVPSTKITNKKVIDEASKICVMQQQKKLQKKQVGENFERVNYLMQCAKHVALLPAELSHCVEPSATLSPEVIGRTYESSTSAYSTVEESPSTHKTYENQIFKNRRPNCKSFATARSDPPPFSAIAANLGSISQGISRKCLLRLSHHIKRDICAGCGTPLIPAQTATAKLVRVRKQKVLMLRCKMCGTRRKMPCEGQKLLWNDMKEAAY